MSLHVAGAGNGDESFRGAIVRSGGGRGSLLSFTGRGNCGPRRQQQERRAAEEREDFSCHAKAPFLMSGKSRERKNGGRDAPPRLGGSRCGVPRYLKRRRIPEPCL